MNRCGYCGAPTMNGSLCKRDWQQLEQLLRRCVGLGADLASAVAKRGRYGEETSGSTAPGLPIGVDAMEARRSLQSALVDAWRRIGATGTPSSVDHAAEVILSRSRQLLACAAAPVLLGDLAELVPAAVRATDKPKGRLSVQVPCLRCGGGPLQPVMGALQCSSCRECMTIGEVRQAVAS